MKTILHHSTFRAFVALSFASASLATAFPGGVALSQAAEKTAWKDLLEGNDLKKHWETTGNWSIRPDGVVTLTPRPGETGWSRWSAYL